MSRILIVDDEPQILRVLRAPLQNAGHEVLTAGNGMEAFEKVQRERLDLIITDLAMPGMNGLELTEEVRRFSQVPIIVVSVRDSDSMKVRALDQGADDYLTKPFSMPELMARVRAHLRRGNEAEQNATAIAAGDFVIDSEAHTVIVRGAEIHLTPKEFALLLAFMRKPERALTHNNLLRQVWGSAYAHQPENLRVLVGNLRKKIEREGGRTYIENEPWVGYRFRPGGTQPD